MKSFPMGCRSSVQTRIVPECPKPPGPDMQSPRLLCPSPKSAQRGQRNTKLRPCPQLSYRTTKSKTDSLNALQAAQFQCCNFIPRGILRSKPRGATGHWRDMEKGQNKFEENIHKTEGHITTAHFKQIVDMASSVASLASARLSAPIHSKT